MLSLGSLALVLQVRKPGQRAVEQVVWGSEWLRVAPGFACRRSGPCPHLVTALHLSNDRSCKNLGGCFWKVGIWHNGTWMESMILAFLDSPSMCKCLLTRCQCCFSLCFSVALSFFFFFFFFFLLLGLLSRLMWPQFHVTSTPLHLRLRKVRVALLCALTSAHSAGPWPVRSVFSFSVVRAHPSTFHPPRWRGSHSRKHLLSENLGLKTFRP